MDILKSFCIWIAGIFLLAFFFPFSLAIWLVVLSFDSERRVIHRILIWQSIVFKSFFPVKRCSCEGKEKIDKAKAYIIISNHQSLLDTIFLNTLGLNYKWISKAENNKIPVLGWYLWMADYISVNRGNDESKAEMMNKAARFLKKGISIMMFPEGTRSANGEIGFFKRGAFALAIETRTPLLPVVIDGTGGILPKNGFVFGAKRDITLKVLDEEPPEKFGTDNPEELALKISAKMKESLAAMRTKI